MKRILMVRFFLLDEVFWEVHLVIIKDLLRILDLATYQILLK